MKQYLLSVSGFGTEQYIFGEMCLFGMEKIYRTKKKDARMVVSLV